MTSVYHDDETGRRDAQVSPPAIEPRRLADYQVNKEDRGRNRAWLIGWLAVAPIGRMWLTGNRVRIRLLRLFGAEVGAGCTIHRSFRVHFPWKLRVGDRVSIDRNVWVIDPEHVEIGSDTSIAADVVLCAGGHDHRSPIFRRTSEPLWIGRGCRIGAGATVLKGVCLPDGTEIGPASVVRAGSISAEESAGEVSR